RDTLLVLAMLSCGGGRAAQGASQLSGTRPETEIFVSAGDNYWVNYLLALDSPASIRDSVEMWSAVFNVKRIYWRGQQDEARLDHALIRKENFLYYDFYQWERYLMKEVAVNRLLVDEAH